MAPIPTPPQPTTTTTSPVCTRAVLCTAPAPVRTPHANSEAEVDGTSAGYETTCERWTTTCSAKAPVLSPWATGDPVPSVSGPCRSRPKSPEQVTWWPRRQSGHSPQDRTSDTTTWLPTPMSSMPGPTSTTHPAASWPITSGKSVAQPPSTYMRSEWQTAQASIRTRTSSGPGAARRSCSMLCGSPTPRQTAARMVVAPDTARNIVPCARMGFSRGPARRRPVGRPVTVLPR